MSPWSVVDFLINATTDRTAQLRTSVRDLRLPIQKGTNSSPDDDQRAPISSFPIYMAQGLRTGSEYLTERLAASFQSVVGVSLSPKEQLEFNTDVFLDILTIFLQNHKDDKDYNEIRYYLGLLLKKHFEDRHRLPKHDNTILSTMDIDFVKDKLNNFAQSHSKNQKDLAGKGAEFILLEILYPHNNNPETHHTKKIRFDPKMYGKQSPVDQARVKHYIDQHLTLTPSEYSVMVIKHKWNSVTEILHALDAIFERALKKAIHFAIDVAFIIAPSYTANFLMKKVADKNLGTSVSDVGATVTNYISSVITDNQFTSYASTKKNHAVRDMAHAKIEKLNLKPSILLSKKAQVTKHPFAADINHAQHTLKQIAKSYAQIRQETHHHNSSSEQRRSKNPHS